jgi:hypothetical protein
MFQGPMTPKGGKIRGTDVFTVKSPNHTYWLYFSMERFMTITIEHIKIGIVTVSWIIILQYCK